MEMCETVSIAEAEDRMAFLATILKVQLVKEPGEKEGPRDHTFVECAQEMVDASARDEEAKSAEKKME